MSKLLNIKSFILSYQPLKIGTQLKVSTTVQLPNFPNETSIYNIGIPIRTEKTMYKTKKTPEKIF